MAFPTAPLVLTVPVKRKGSLFLFENTTILTKYAHVAPLLHERSSPKGEDAPMSAAPEHKPPRPKQFTFEVSRVERQDGIHCRHKANELPRQYWDTDDAGEWTYNRNKRVEQRLVALTFKGRELSAELAKQCHEGNAALFETFVEQGSLHISVRVDKELEVPLLLKVGVVVMPA